MIDAIRRHGWTITEDQRPGRDFGYRADRYGVTMSARRLDTLERMIDARHDEESADPDAPPVPRGLQRRPGVEYGCGLASCRDCYEPDPRALGSLQNPAVR